MKIQRHTFVEGERLRLEPVQPLQLLYEDIRKFTEIKKKQKAQPRNRSCTSHYYNNAFIEADADRRKFTARFALAGISPFGWKNSRSTPQ